MNGENKSNKPFPSRVSVLPENVTSGVLLFPRAVRTYCETDIDPAHRKLSQLQAAVRYLTGKEPDLECKRTFLISSLALREIQFNP